MEEPHNKSRNRVHIKLTLNLDRDDDRRLWESLMAHKGWAPVSFVIRLALEEYLKRRGGDVHQADGISHVSPPRPSAAEPTAWDGEEDDVADWLSGAAIRRSLADTDGEPR